MRSWVLALVVFVGGFLLVAVVCRAPESGAAEVRTLDLVVQRPAGPPVLLQFVVAARDGDEALAAAERAAKQLVPGGTVGFEPGDVAAAWRQWGWSWDPDEIPVVVAYNPEGAAPAVSPDAILHGLQQWSGVPGSAFRFEYGGITDSTASILEEGPDGENVVWWKSLPCEPGCVLGVTSKELDHEADLVLNSNPAAATQAGIGGNLDWRTVILHELGHVAGLEHSCPVPFGPCTDDEIAAVMYYQYTGLQRHLEEDDIAGMAALYPELGTPTPTPPPIATPTPFPTPSPFPETIVHVERGWNLVILPSGDPARIGDEMSCVTAIYGWDGAAWRAWIKGLIPGVQDLTSVVSGVGYWVLADGECTGEFAGF